jgi:micrococcal nuclease
MAPVVRVVDGDTIIVRLGGRQQRLRYLGMNTPESVDPRREVQCFGKEAAARNRELVDGKTVWLEKDVSDTDQYGRLLRYVSVNGLLVNAELVREGYAHALTYPPDVRYAERFRALEREAREAKRGLWGGC